MQSIVITGAATGFGRAAAELLARRGYRVFATMRDPEGRNGRHREALEELAATEGVTLTVVEMDVTSDASVEAAAGAILGQAGAPDVVINNAGIGAIGVTEAYTAAEYQALFNVNVFGVVRVNRAFLPSMRAARRGLVIHVSSGAGRVAIPCMAAYCASKFALEALADTYRFELAPFGIEAVLVEPGAHRTPILENFAEPSDAARVAEYGEAGKYADIVRGRFAAVNDNPESPGPEIVAQAYLDLIEMPAGQRPFRTVPTEGLRPVLAACNELAESMRRNTAERYGVTELLQTARS